MSVLLETSLGDIVIDLLWEKAPLASKNFIKLCKIKYYNGTLFFDVQKNYLTRVMHEKKEPTSLNSILYGEQAKYFEDQINPEARHDKIGTVSTANIGPNMNNSNFFITLSDDNIESLNGKHTIFGHVAEGVEVLRKINEVYIDDTNRPFENIRILHTLVLDDPFDDPEGLEIPENSPEINYDDTDRLDVNDKHDLIDKNGRTEEEIIEDTKRHEAKTKAIVLEMLNDLPDADIKPPENVLFVCKLNPVTQEDDLETIFSQFGPIKSCEVIRDWKTGASLQYSFIEFETEAACTEAFFKMENALIDERRIHVDFSQSVSKYWYKYKSGNPIAFEKGKGGGPEAGGRRNHPKLELKRQHREDKGGYGIVIDEDEAAREGRRHKNQKGENREERDRPKEKEKEREREQERVQVKKRSNSRERNQNRKKYDDSRSRPRKDKSRSRSPRRDKHDSKRRDGHREEKSRDDRHRSRHDDRRHDKKREDEHRNKDRRSEKKEDKRKKKVSSSRSSSSSSSSNSSKSSSRSSS